MDPPPRSSVDPSTTPTSTPVSATTQSTMATQYPSATPATTVEAESGPPPPATPPHVASSATQTEKEVSQRPGQSILSLMNPVSASEGLPQHTHANNATNSILSAQPLTSQPTYHAHQEVPSGTTRPGLLEMSEPEQENAVGDILASMKSDPHPPAAWDSEDSEATISAPSSVSSESTIPTPVTDTGPTTPAQGGNKRRRDGSPKEGRRRSKRAKRE